MSNYELIERMNECFYELELALDDLTHLLGKLERLDARVFVLPEIEKGKENDPLDQIAVTPLAGDVAHQRALQHFRRLFIQDNAGHISSKSAVRLPGVLCYAVSPDERQAAQLLIEEVNKLKAELEHIVTVESGLEREQRFEFVHTHLRGLITLNAYRSVTYLLNPGSVRFGWANKQIIKNVTREEIVDQLNRSLKAGRAVAPYTREQWAEHVTREINDIMRLPEKAALKIRRPVKVQPIARAWYPAEQKQVQHPCPMPLITLCERVGKQVKTPKLGELPDYDVNAIKHKYRPAAQPLHLVIPRLHLYTDHRV